MVRGAEPMRGDRERVMEAEVRDHHEWQISQGSSGWLPWLVERSDAQGSERSGWGWHDTDPMGRVPRQPGRAAADRGEGVRLDSTVTRVVDLIDYTNMFETLCAYSRKPVCLYVRTPDGITQGQALRSALFTVPNAGVMSGRIVPEFMFELMGCGRCSASLHYT